MFLMPGPPSPMSVLFSYVFLARRMHVLLGEPCHELTRPRRICVDARCGAWQEGFPRGTCAVSCLQLRVAVPVGGHAARMSALRRRRCRRAPPCRGSRGCDAPMGKTKMTSKTARGRHKRAETFLDAIWLAIGGEPDALARVAFAGEGDLPSVFAVSDLAAASIGAAGLALAAFAGLSRPRPPAVIVDRRLAAHWFARSLKPEGWSMPPIWDSIADDYAAADGWIRLHTNVPLHRAAALAVLGVPADRDAVRAAVRRWRADDLEAAIHARGGCAAAMRSQAAWAAHPQGKAVAAEPLVWDMAATMADRRERLCNPARPLAGVRVLDLTRIIAGPVATRFLAGFGAEVLRIDPPE